MHQAITFTSKRSSASHMHRITSRRPMLTSKWQDHRTMHSPMLTIKRRNYTTTHSHSLHAKQSNATGDKTFHSTRATFTKIKKPSARTDTPPPATNPNRGNVKNHQMRQTPTQVEATSITSDETTSTDTGTCRIYARAEQGPKIEDNCLISIVKSITATEGHLTKRCTAAGDKS